MTSPCKQWRPPAARKCCCCVPVRRGVIIFGYVNLVVSLLTCPLLVYMLAEQITQGVELGAESGVELGGVQPGEAQPGGVQPGGAELGGSGLVARLPQLYLPLSLALVLLDTALTVLLLVGAHQKRRALLLVYLWLGLALQTLTLVVDLLFLQLRDLLQNIVYFIILCMNLYLVYLVYSAAELLRVRDVRYVEYREPAPAPPAARNAPLAEPAQH